jgi:branched-chain amino acid transport system permease protein
MTPQSRSRAPLMAHWQSTAKTGLMGGMVLILVCLVGLVEASHRRAIIPGVVSMGHTIVLLLLVAFAQMAVQRLVKEQSEAPSRSQMVVTGAMASLLVAAALVLLVLVGQVVNLRWVFANASPALYDVLTLGLSVGGGAAVLLGLGVAVGALMGLVLSLSGPIRRAVLIGLGLIPTVAILNSALFAGRGVSLLGAIVVFVVGAGASYLWSTSQGRVEAIKEQINSTPRGRTAMERGRWAVPAVLILMLPLLGSYPSEVLNEVARFALMGLGLNIVVGFAGLLDLGYVAFFAIGAYTMGVLTSPEIGWLGFHLTFWEALPAAVGVAILSGIVLGVPVLGMRGDYLAIVTLGFGEIIQRLAISDWLKPYIGGSNGITLIPKAVIGPVTFGTPQTLFYIFLAGCALVAFISIRVKDSRLGRAWMALREDEDVAQAMGIDLIRTKLLAFATGAAFAGLSGAIFASKLASIYPHSFHLLISINVLCLIIVGGMGNISGVIVGSLALVGLPELLREFAEYRLLLYGAALVAMMLMRPEGLLPEARRTLELHEPEVGGTD